VAKFPEYGDLPIDPSYDLRIKWKTLINRFNDEGQENRKQKWLYPRRDFSIVCKNITKANAEVLWEFYNARKGSYGEFNFFVPEPEETYPSYTGEYVHVGDGSTDVFNLPCKWSSARTLYVAGIVQTEDDDYTFTALGGEDGADKIDFEDSSMSPPSNGAVILLNFTGILKVRCRFAEDIMSFKVFMDRVATIGVEITGLLHDAA